MPRRRNGLNFSEEDEEKLISIVARHPVLYDTFHDNYRDNLTKDNVWKAIGTELQKSGVDCKKKWKFIRDGYFRFRKKHELGSSAPKNAKGKRHELLTFLEYGPQPEGSPASASPVGEYDEPMGIEECLVQSIMEKKDDDIDLFTRYIGEVLRNLPPVEKAQAKKHLHAVISDYEIKAAKSCE